MINPGDLAPHVPRPLLSASARICGFPSVVLGDLAVSSEEAWHQVVERGTAQDRLDLLTLLEPHMLVAFPRGQERLEWDAANEDDGADVEPHVFGDAEVLALLRQALALMPPLVASVARREAAWVAVGRESAAWTTRASFAGTDGRERHRIVAVGPKADVRVLMHEAVHLFFARRADEKGIAATVQAEAAINALAASDPEAWKHAIQSRDDEEIVADALSLVWLYRSPAGRPS